MTIMQLPATIEASIGIRKSPHLSWEAVDKSTDDKAWITLKLKRFIRSFP